MEFSELLKTIRTEKNYTQEYIASKLNVTTQAVSKWERGLSFPDVGLLDAISSLLEVSIESLINGKVVINSLFNGNMKKVNFYYCRNCNNIIYSLNEVNLLCCSKKTEKLIPSNEKFDIFIEKIEDELYITSNHQMEKDDYIYFIAYVTGDKLFFTKLYPEMNVEVRFKNVGHGIIYYFSIKEGLFYKNI